LRRKTVLILGAGASKIFGLPLGAELRNQIANDLELKFDEWGQRLVSGSYEIVEALRVLNRTPEGRAGNINPHRAAAVEISDAMPFSSSIDEYIERHADDPLKATCAKLAIAKAILEAERSSSLYVDPYSGDSRLHQNASNTWLAHFLRDLTRARNRGNVAEAFENLTVINFNYDRCFEQFVFDWLQMIYRLDRQQARAIISELQIYHPYGRLAPLDWEDDKGIKLGGELDTIRLIKMAQRIRTYSEAKEPEGGIDFVKERISAASCFVFLGFGFHQQNLDLLTVDGKRRSSLWCYATTLGISKPSWSIFQSRIKHMLSIAPERDLHCSDFSGDCEGFWNEYATDVLG